MHVQHGSVAVDRSSNNNSSQCTVCASSGCGYGVVQALYSKCTMLLFLLDAIAQCSNSAQSTCCNCLLLINWLHFKYLSCEHICSLTLEGPSLLGLSHISVNASMAINDTALTSSTISRLEAPDPIDTLDLTVCPADDILDGCKVSWRIIFIY